MTTPQLELPAALLHVRPRTDHGPWEGLVDRLVATLGPRSGLYRPRRGLLAVLPIAGDPAALDTAASWARALIGEAAERQGGRAAEATLLIAPGTVRVDGGTAEPLADPLLDDLEARPPELPPNRVHLTGRAALSLERRGALEAAGRYQGPSGRVVPLYLVDPEAGDVRPWRNPTLLGRTPRPVRRPALAFALARAAALGPLRVVGPIGVGKTRLTLETLGAGAGTLLYATAPAPRSAEPGLTAQIVGGWLALDEGSRSIAAEARGRSLAAARRRLFGGDGTASDDASALTALMLRAADRLAAAGRGPVVLVCDDLHNAGDGDLELLARLLEASRPDRLRMVLVGRPAGRWPAGGGEIAQVEVPPFEEDESSELADLLLGTMSIPSAVRNRLLAAAAGNPFFFEEGLVGLMRRKEMRQSYGNFFFSGDEDTAYEPSQRLIQHAEAEAGRLGDARALRLLALGGAPLPAAEVRSAVAVLEPEAPLGGDWHRSYLAAGVLAEMASPWGAGVYLRYPALAAALAGTMPDGEAPRVRQLLGELLAGRSEDAAGRWHRYRLLAGSPEAVELALRLARDPGLAAAGIGDREQLAALDAERAALRGRGGDARAELELTLARSRIAFRLARLEGVSEDLARALALAPEGGVPPATRFAAAQLKAEVDRLSGRLQQAEQTIEATLRESAGVDEASKAALLVDLARVLMEQQRHDEAEKLLGRILSSIPPDEPSELVASCRFYLGSVALRRRDTETALTHHREALAARRRLGSEPKALTASLTALGGVYLELGRYSEALDSYREAEQTARELDDDLELAFVLLGLGRALGRLGDFAAASAPLRQALALREGSGDALGEAIAGLAVAESYVDLDRPREALRAAREAHFRLTLLGEGAPLGRAERILGRILLGRSRETANAHLLRALELHEASGDRLAAAFDRAWLLEAATAGGRVDEVRRHGAALAEFLGSADYPEQGEQLDYRLFKALWWLREQGEKGGDALVHLERAYRELLRKAGHLDPDLRQRFLSQIPANQAIITAATRHRLTG